MWRIVTRDRVYDGRAFEAWLQLTSRKLGKGQLTPLPPPWTLAATLEHLHPSIWEDHYQRLRASIASLTCLTHLRVSINEDHNGYYWPQIVFSIAWRRAKFLRPLTRLKHLHLGNILHSAHVAANLRDLVGLTQLTYLGLQGYATWYGRGPESDKGQFRKFEEQGGLLQVTRLSMLSELCVSEKWAALAPLP